MQKSNTVHEVVGRKIKSIKKLDEREDVYCLSTQQNGNFVANGIIVKNCDATRYALYTHKVSSYVAPVPEKTNYANYGQYRI